MSVKSLRADFRKVVLSVITMVITQSAMAFDLAAPFVDPLQTLPPIIESGPILPGDGGPVPCPASKDFESPLVLAEAVDLALCNNPQVRSVWAAIKVQASALGEARAAYFPTVSGTVNQLQTHTTYSGSGVAASTTRGRTLYGTLTWRLFDFGGRAANRESANNLLTAAMANQDATLQKILSAVVQTYFDAQTTKAVLYSKEQNEAIARATLESAQRREARGAISRGDTLQAATALAKASLEKNRAFGDFKKALSVLVYVLGIPAQTQVILADDFSDKLEIDARSLDDWLNIAGTSHPAILAARAQWESAKQRVIATRSEGLPTLDFTDSYYKNGYPGQGISPTQSTINTVGFSINIPIFDGFSRTYRIRGAEAQVAQRAADLDNTENNTLMDVVKTHADAVASVQNLQASENLLNAAQESLNASKRRYERGAADITELLSTQTALSDAQQERIRSQAEWRSARLRLLASAGLMGRQTLAR